MVIVELSTTRELREMGTGVSGGWPQEEHPFDLIANVNAICAVAVATLCLMVTLMYLGSEIVGGSRTL